jgi:hypothetical protein
MDQVTGHRPSLEILDLTKQARKWRRPQRAS